MNADRQKLIIVTGVGYRETGCHDDILNVYDSPNAKANIGSWIAHELASAGLNLLLMSRRKERLTRVKNSLHEKFPNSQVDCEAIDLLDAASVRRVVSRIVPEAHVNLVHSVGLSAGNYKVLNDNPYLEVEGTPPELPVLEFEIVVKTLLILVQAFLPRFIQQQESHIVVVSSMSGIRAYPLGYSHASAKAGLHNAVRSLCLELNKRNIYVSEVLPGIVDTGLYDSPEVQKAVVKIGRAFDYDYEKIGLPQTHPREVAEAVKLCLVSQAHILAINMVSKGQWPNMGA